MKLYFYILDRKLEFNVETRTFEKSVYKIRFEECDVIEKPKTYAPVDVFPKGVYTSYIKKESIGGFVGCYGEIIVLDEKNYKRAKEIFLKRYNREINTLKDNISTYEDMVDAVENFKED